MESGRPGVRLRALVTGGPPGTCPVVAALERQGFSVATERWAGRRGAVPLPPGPFDCYVQLPWASPPGDAARWLPDRLDARVDLLAAVAPRLAPRANVVLAVDDGDTGRAEASADLLSALAMVVLEESGRPDVRVSTGPAAELCGPPGAQAARGGVMLQAATGG